MTEHPITPPPELVEQYLSAAHWRPCPMANPYRALCSELVEQVQRAINDHGLCLEASDALMHRARALLDQPETQPPADGEVAASLIELRSTVMGLGQMGMHVAAKRVERAADLLQRQHPQPVAVSERPWEREGWCDKRERCWYGAPNRPGAVACWDLEFEPATDDTYCLPANALPTPEATND